MCSLFSAEEPDSLRGHQFELIWIDELALMRYAKKTFDNAMLGLRLGEKPRLIVTTTPRPSAFLKDLIKMDGMSVTRASTFDNHHLSEGYLKRMRDAYEGTESGRQELAGELILQPRDALFLAGWFRHEEIANEKIEQATVAVDPSGGADLVGIVGAALLTDGTLAVLGDYSTGGTPSHWAETAIRARDQLDADDICAETNFGGAMVIETIKQAAIRMHEHGERQTDMIRVREVVASKGKTLRAEPVSLQYERGRVIHRKGVDLNKLEASFSRDWDRTRDGSPNRTDAAAWALTRLSKIITNIPIA
jgi:phage terminase large subunit-like protein